MHRCRASTIAILLAAIVITPLVSEAQTTTLPAVQTGCHAITADERAGLQAMGATIPVNGEFCDKDKALLYGGCQESPYPYLQTKNKTGRTDSVSGLNSDFACRMMKFLKAADAAGMNIVIGSGYRSVTMQTGMYNAWIAGGKSGPPVAPPGRSKHNFGLAIDLNYNGTIGPRNTAQCVATLAPCKWAHSNEAQFGLRWPMEYEPWHIEPSGTVNGKQQPLPEGGWTGDQSTTPYTNTGAPYTPSMWQPQMAPQPMPPMPQQPAPQQQTPLPNGSTVPAPQDSRFSPTYPVPVPNGGTLNYTPPAPYEYPATTTQQTVNTNQNTNTNINTNTPSPTSASTGGSASAGGSSDTSTGSSVSTQLNGESQNSTGGTNDATDNTNADAPDKPNSPNNVSNISNIRYATATAPVATPSDTSVAVAPVGATETFAHPSTDASVPRPNTNAANGTAAQPLVVALLTSLRDMLASFANTLKQGSTYGFQGAWQPMNVF